MKPIISSLLVIFFCTAAVAQESTIIDSRDDQSYEIIKIGNRWWMNENLNYNTPLSYCYLDEPLFCEKYGRLYHLDVLTDVCPEGWQLPSRKDVDSLFRAIGFPPATSQYTYTFGDSWQDIDQRRLNGFNITRTGWRNRKKYANPDSFNMWIADEKKATHLHMYHPDKELLAFVHQHEKHNPVAHKRQFAVRCVKSYK